MLAQAELVEAFMSAADKVFGGAIPEFYDTYMVPLIFQPYAIDLAQRTASLSPELSS